MPFDLRKRRPEPPIHGIIPATANRMRDVAHKLGAAGLAVYASPTPPNKDEVALALGMSGYQVSWCCMRLYDLGYFTTASAHDPLWLREFYVAEVL